MVKPSKNPRADIAGKVRIGENVLMPASRLDDGNRDAAQKLSQVCTNVGF